MTAPDSFVVIPEFESSKMMTKVENKTIPERIPAFGLLLSLLGVTFFSAASLIVKLIAELHSIEILVFRCLVQLILYFTITIVKRYPFFGQPSNRIHLGLRCISGTISLITIYMAYKLIPLSDANTIYQSSPVFVTVFAYILLKEPITILNIITGSITLIGVFIISKPEFVFGAQKDDQTDETYDDRVLGIILSIIAAVNAAFAMICMRKLKTAQVPVVVMWFSFTVVVIGSILLPFLDEWVMPSGVRTWLLLLAIGVAGILNQYFQTTALKYESPGPISVTRSFNIVLSFIWDVAIFAETVEWTSIFGAILISCCVVVIAMCKCHKENPQFLPMFLRKICINFINNKHEVQNIQALENTIKINTTEHIDENLDVNSISVTKL